MTVFQRAEASTFFGREIGLMYMHAHLRYAEALARVGDGERAAARPGPGQPASASPSACRTARPRQSTTLLLLLRRRLRRPRTTPSERYADADGRRASPSRAAGGSTPRVRACSSGCSSRTCSACGRAATRWRSTRCSIRPSGRLVVRHALRRPDEFVSTYRVRGPRRHGVMPRDRVRCRRRDHDPRQPLPRTRVSASHLRRTCWRSDRGRPIERHVETPDTRAGPALAPRPLHSADGKHRDRDPRQADPHRRRAEHGDGRRDPLLPGGPRRVGAADRPALKSRPAATRSPPTSRGCATSCPTATIDVDRQTRPERDLGAFIDLCARARPVVHRPARPVHHGRAEERGPARTGSTPSTRRSSRSAGTARRRRRRTVDYLAPAFLAEARRWYGAVMPVLAAAPAARRRQRDRRPARQRDRHARLGHELARPHRPPPRGLRPVGARRYARRRRCRTR